MYSNYIVSVLSLFVISFETYELVFELSIQCNFSFHEFVE